MADRFIPLVGPDGLGQVPTPTQRTSATLNPVFYDEAGMAYVLPVGAGISAVVFYLTIASGATYSYSNLLNWMDSTRIIRYASSDYMYQRYRAICVVDGAETSGQTGENSTAIIDCRNGDSFHNLSFTSSRITNTASSSQSLYLIFIG